MLQFTCAHEECGSQLTASSKDALVSQVIDHVKKDHDVHTATQTLQSYLVATCVTTVPDR
ncbi:MAG: DUF1059 domain-containing protein [Pseudonocardiaceae bacterium]